MDMSDPDDQGHDETDPFGEVVVDLLYNINPRADHRTQESTSILETMETEEIHQIGSPSPLESQAECQNDNVTNESHCLICYKAFKPPTACETEFDNFMNPTSSWQLLKVFSKHMGVQVPSDDEVEMDVIFCDKCQECVKLLSQLDAELESVHKMISKLVLGCTAVVMESPRIAWQPNGQFLETIRKDIFNRNCPQISLRDCCHEMDRVSIDRDDTASFASYMESDIEMGADEGNNAGDPVVGLTDDEEQQGQKEEVVVKEEILPDDDTQAMSLDCCNCQTLTHCNVKNCPRKSNLKKKGKCSNKKKIIEKEWIDPPFKPKEKPSSPVATRKSDRICLRDRRQIEEDFEQRPVYAKVNGVETRVEEIKPGKYLFLQRFNFAKKVDDDKFQCSACDTQPLFDSLEDIVLHIRSEHAHQMEPWMLRPKSDQSFYYHGVRVDCVGRSYICSLCPKFKKTLKGPVMSHIYFKHYRPSLRPKEVVETEDEHPVVAQESTNEDGQAGANPEEPNSSPRSECTEDDKVPEPEPEDSMDDNGDDDNDDEDYVPDDALKEKRVKEIKKKKEEKKRFKLIEPGKYLYLNKFEVEKAEDGTYVCLLCKCTRSVKRNLLNHIRRTHLNKKGPYRVLAATIDIGNNEFLYAGKKFTKFQDQYSCGECGFSSEKLGALKQHIRYHHLRPLKGKPERPMCEECGKTFGSKQALHCHRDRVHCDGEKSELCPTCGKAFVSAMLLKLHMRGHNRILPKNFVCEHCGKAFDGNQKLISHVTTHTGERPFECSHCGRKFKAYNVMCVHRKACRISSVQVTATQAECSVAPVERSSVAPAECQVAPAECPVAPVECPVATVECPVAPAECPVAPVEYPVASAECPGGPAVCVVTGLQQPQQAPAPPNTGPASSPNIL